VLGEALGVELGVPLVDDLGLLLGKPLGSALEAELGEELGAALGDALGSELGRELGDTLGDALGPELGRELGSALGDLLDSVLGEALGVEHGAPLDDKLRLLEQFNCSGDEGLRFMRMRSDAYTVLLLSHVQTLSLSLSFEQSTLKSRERSRRSIDYKQLETETLLNSHIYE
jgi:hypothetical protein